MSHMLIVLSKDGTLTVNPQEPVNDGVIVAPDQLCIKGGVDVSTLTHYVGECYRGEMEYYCFSSLEEALEDAKTSLEEGICVTIGRVVYNTLK